MFYVFKTTGVCRLLVKIISILVLYVLQSPCVLKNMFHSKQTGRSRIENWFESVVQWWFLVGEVKYREMHLKNAVSAACDLPWQCH